MYICIIGVLGIVFFFSSFRRAPIPFTPSNEAKQETVAFTMAEVVWLKNLLFELGVTCNKPSVVVSDNLSALYMCTDPIFHNRSKHIEIDYHFIREKISEAYYPFVMFRIKINMWISSQRHEAYLYLFISTTSLMFVLNTREYKITN